MCSVSYSQVHELFGQVAGDCLLYIRNYGEGHIGGICRTFGHHRRSVQLQLHRFEAAGILTSRFLGPLRIFEFSKQNELNVPLGEFLELCLGQLDRNTTDRYFRQRRRPAYTTKRYRVKDKRAVLFERDQGICRICNKFDADWEMDHVIPLSEGGQDEIPNLRTLCVACHSQETTLAKEAHC